MWRAAGEARSIGTHRSRGALGRGDSSVRSRRLMERQAPMPRRTVDRFPIRQPSDAALRRYYRSYDGATLYHAPDTLPDITPADLFGNARPLILDLGCGRGEFLINEAQRHPERNYAGLDFQRKYLYDAVNHAAALDLDNLLF